MGTPLKLLIYLADLDHFYPGNRISVPYNIGSIASYSYSLFGNEVEILLFKHPEELLEKVRSAPPNVLGLSFYMWNVNLVRKVITCCKMINSDTITVIGGPSVSRISDHYKRLLDNNPDLDIIVLDQGEKSFANIISRILSTGFHYKQHFDETISGCATRLGNSNTVERGDLETDYSVLNSIPSPYLNGYLDSFLELGFLPQLETNRGCPYSCIYCGYGDKYYSKLVVRDEKIIYEEILYLLKHSKSKELSITDGNFGIMGKRDLRIAEFMFDLYKENGFPYVTDFASSKVKTKTSIEVMKIMARLTDRMYFGLQTLTEEALVNSKRQNIPKDMISELVDIAKKENIPHVCVDLIFGLPGETPQSFLNTISELVSLGIEQPAIYQLRLLPGTSLYFTEKEKYNYKSMFRPFNNRFGEYKLIADRKAERIIEVEEIAYQSNTFNSDDFMKVREYGFLTELLMRYGSYKETILFLSYRDISMSGIFNIILQNYKKYPLLSDLFKMYKLYSRGELYETEEDLIKSICENDKQWEDLLLLKGSYFKINFGFVGYCLFNEIGILDNLEQIIRELARERLLVDEIENLEQVIKYDKCCRLIQKENGRKQELSDVKKELVLEDIYDYETWRLNCYKGKLSEYMHDVPIKRNFYIDKYEELMREMKNLAEFSGFPFYERIIINSPMTSLRRYCKVMN